MKLLIIADDFTGALDTGVQLSKHSIRTVVMSDPDTSPDLPADCEVLVINAGIRHSKPQAAYRCIQDILARYADSCPYLYIKTDSALRGNTSAAFAAATEFLGCPLYFIPAFPTLGRTTKDGYAYVDGQLLEHSVFRNDPRTPTTKSFIPDILNESHKLAVACYSPDRYHTFTHPSPKDAMIHLFDCETDEQLQELGRMLSENGRLRLSAGCAGFAAALADTLAFARTPDSLFDNKGAVLFVSGSANAVTLGQLAYAKQKGYPVLSLSNDITSAMRNANEKGTDTAPQALRSFSDTCQKAAEFLKNHRSVILATAASKEELLCMNQQENFAFSEEYLHNYIANYTSFLVKSIIDEAAVEKLVIFGGDMVAAILEKLDCHQVTAAGEITPGVPLCCISYGGRECTMATKSGGFGREDVIPAIEQYLQV